jgi:hypothetical protein
MVGRMLLSGQDKTGRRLKAGPLCLRECLDVFALAHEGICCILSVSERSPDVDVQP